eukprot:tig00000381_g24541.t1
METGSRTAAESRVPIRCAQPRRGVTAGSIRDLINAGLRRHDHTRMSAALAPVTSKKTPLFTRNFGRMHRPRPNAINPVARVAVTRSLTFAAAPSAKSTNSDADSVREPKTRTYCALGDPVTESPMDTALGPLTSKSSTDSPAATSQQEGNVSKGSGRPTPNYKAPPAKMPEIDSLPAVEGCESLVPLCTDWLDNVAYNMHTRRVNNRMHVDGIQCTDWLRDGIPSSDQRQIHARTILYCPALQMLTTYLEPKGPGVCWARASNYRTAVFTEDAHMPRRRDLSFANETETEFFVIARDISGHAKNGRFPIPPALDVNPGIPCADGTHAHHSHPHWHLLATRPLINPKGHSEHKRLNAAVTRIIADTATEDDVTTLRTWIAIARETTTIAAINTNISNTNEQLRRPYRGAEGEQLLHLVEMAAMAITNTGAPPPRTRQAAANHVTSVLRKELEAFDVDTTVQAIVNALCARRVFTFTDGAMDTTDAPPAPTTTLTLPGAAVVESLLNRVKTSFTDAQNRSPTFMRPNRRTAAVNYVESTLRTYLRGYDVESTIVVHPWTPLTATSLRSGPRFHGYLASSPI